jgi:hypothetical protein
MPFMKCSVDGCSRRLQPILKVDPRDRETWFYRECDVCFRPVCEDHSVELNGEIICDRCRRTIGAPPPPIELLDLGTKPLPKDR